MARVRILPSGLALVFASSLLLLASSPALGDMYEWTDGRGNVGYADSLESVPVEHRKSARRIETKGKGKLQTAPSSSGRDADMSSLPSLEEAYAPWQSRIRLTRAELDKLKAQREKAQALHDDILAQWRVRGSRLDPEKEAQAAAAVKELDQRIQEKEYELNTTIPDQARQAGVPSSALSQ